MCPATLFALLANWLVVKFQSNLAVEIMTIISRILVVEFTRQITVYTEPMTATNLSISCFTWDFMCICTRVYSRDRTLQDLKNDP